MRRVAILEMRLAARSHTMRRGLYNLVRGKYAKRVAAETSKGSLQRDRCCLLQ